MLQYIVKCFVNQRMRMHDGVMMLQAHITSASHIKDLFFPLTPKGNS